MARHLFGGAISDFVVAYGADGALLLSASATVTFWDAKIAGTQYTDLQDLTDTAITEVTSDGTGAIPQLRGPDGVRSMWAAPSADGSGDRHLVLAVDLPADIAALEARAAVLESTVATQQTMLGSALYGLQYDAGASAYPTVPVAVAGRRLLWVGPVIPAAARAGDLHVKTFE